MHACSFLHQHLLWMIKLSLIYRVRAMSQLTYSWGNIASSYLCSIHTRPNHTGSRDCTLATTLWLFLMAPSSLRMRTKQMIIFENKFHTFSRARVELTSSGIASVCDTNMLRHTTAITAMRQSFINLDIAPEAKLLQNFLSQINKWNPWSINITRRL